jgi:hypothetical protein
MKIQKSILVIFITFLSLQAVSAESSNDEKIMITIDFSMPGSSVFFSKGLKNDHSINRDTDGQEPTTVMFGLGFQYNGFSLNGEFNIIDGSKLYDFSGTFFTDKIGLEFMTQKYRGYYFQDSDGGDLYNADGSKKEDENLTVTFSKINLYYFIIENFSYNDVFVKYIGAPEFRWSPFLKVSPGYFLLENDDPIIPAEYETYYSESMHDMTELECYTLAVSAGVAMVIPIQKFYISPVFSIGYQRSHYNHNGELGTKDGWGNDMAFDVKLLIAYKYEEISIGYWFCNDNQFLLINDTRIQVLNFQMKLFGSMRF